jgi:hypothetical protein
VGVGFGKIVWNVDVDPSKPARLARLAQGVGELVGVDGLGHDSRASAGGDRDDRLLGGHDLEREAGMGDVKHVSAGKYRPCRRYTVYLDCLPVHGGRYSDNTNLFESTTKTLQPHVIK